jgi:DNA-binding CsgD family transcriptional regulator
MRSFWEQIGVLGPIYRLLGKDLNSDDIAARLNITPEKVESCTAWLVHFLTLKNRRDLVLYASRANSPTFARRSATVT